MLNEASTEHLRNNIAVSEAGVVWTSESDAQGRGIGPSNIADGKGRLTDRDRTHFYLQARGSLLELETQILIAQQLNYVSLSSAEPLLQLSSEIGRMLNGLVEAIAPHATQPRQAASRA